MPNKPNRYCPRCHGSYSGKRCPCTAPAKDLRESAAKRLYDAKWKKVRNAYIRDYPLCVECLKEGRTEEATVVDHVIPHRRNVELFRDHDNLQGLCEFHHNRKTGRGE